MGAGKNSKTAAANEKLASGKLLLASTKLVQDQLPLGSLKAKSCEDSSNQDDNHVKLPPMKAGKEPRTAVAIEKSASRKLLSTSTNFVLEIGQNVRAKKVFTLKTG